MPDQAATPPDDPRLDGAEQQGTKPVRPYGQRVLVEDPPATQDSGIIIPESAQDLKRSMIVALPGLQGFHSGIVFTGGAEMPDMPDLGLKVGDIIYHRPNCGDEVEGNRRLIDLDCIRAVEP